MSYALQSRRERCPCCGEAIELLIDDSAGRQEYVEDCEVCCRPICVVVDVGSDGVLHVTVRDENS